MDESDYGSLSSDSYAVDEESVVDILDDSDDGSDQQGDESYHGTSSSGPEKVEYDPAAVGRILKTFLRESSLRVTGEALDGFSEYLRLFTREAILRANQEREKRGADTLDSNHLAEIAGTLILDF